MVEQSIRNRQVVGSTPTLGSIFDDCFPLQAIFISESVCGSPQP